MINEITSFISRSEAESIRATFSGCFKEARTLGRKIENYRVAENAFLTKNEPCLFDIIHKLSVLTGVPVENQESPQIIKYNQGGEYKEHHDFFHSTENYFARQVSRGGQRIKSCLIYLNEEFEGGETKFITKDLLIKPRTGKLLLWDNVHPDGSPDYDSLHAGLPVLSGVKYILIIWMRERKFV
jgi:prolyl 4-hydroxylase